MRVNNTLTSGITTRSSVISTRRVLCLHALQFWYARIWSRYSQLWLQNAQEWFIHVECDFDTYDCDFDTNECDYDTHECDFYTKSVIFKRIVILTRMNVIMIL
jgi:hypothetical protein